MIIYALTVDRGRTKVLVTNTLKFSAKKTLPETFVGCFSIKAAPPPSSSVACEAE